MKKINFDKKLILKNLPIIFATIIVTAAGIYFSRPTKTKGEFDVNSLNNQVQNHEKRIGDLETKTDNTQAQTNQNSADIKNIQQNTNTTPAPTAPAINTPVEKTTQDVGSASPQEPTATLSYPNDYPYGNLEMDSGIDPWGMYYRESVSYTAWKVQSTFGSMPKWGFQSPNGNAVNWPLHANRDGIPMGTSPKVHSVAINSNNGTQYGFSAWVEAIDGDKVVATAYNWNGAGEFSTRSVLATYFDTYIYFGDR